MVLRSSNDMGQHLESILGDLYIYIYIYMYIYIRGRRSVARSEVSKQIIRLGGSFRGRLGVIPGVF